MNGGLRLRPSGGPFRGAAAFLRALVGTEPAALGEWLAANSLDEDAAGWLRAQGLAPYAFYRLREAGLLARLPEAAQAALRSAFYAAAAQHALLASELGPLLAELRPLGIAPIVLKGMALGATLYPAPATRPTSDLDLLIKRPQVEAVKRLLVARGYRDMGLAPEQHQAFTNHLHVWREYAGGQRVGRGGALATGPQPWLCVADAAGRAARPRPASRVRRLCGPGARSGRSVDPRLCAPAVAPRPELEPAVVA